MPTLTLRPNSDKSSALAVFGSGSGNYDRVNEVTADDTNGVATLDVSYVYDRYELPDPTQNGVINDVAVYGRCKGGHTSCMAKFGCYLGSSVYYATGRNVTTSYVLYHDTWAVSPATGLLWTWVEINDLSVVIGLRGYPVDKKTVAPAYCSQVYCVVDYSIIPIIQYNRMLMGH